MPTLQQKILLLFVYTTFSAIGKFELTLAQTTESIINEETLRDSIIQNLETGNVAEAVSLSQLAEASLMRDVVKALQHFEQRQSNLKIVIKYGDQLLESPDKAHAVFEEIYNVMARQKNLLKRNELFFLYYAVERAIETTALSNEMLQTLLSLKNTIEPHKNALVLKKKASSGKAVDYYKLLNKIPRAASLGLVLNSFIAELTDSLNLTEKVNLLPFLYYVENRCFFANLMLNDLQHFDKLSESEEMFALWIFMKHQIRFFEYDYNFTSKEKCYLVFNNLTEPVKPMWEKYEDIQNEQVSPTLKMKFPRILQLYQTGISPESLFIA